MADRKRMLPSARFFLTLNSRKILETMIYTLKIIEFNKLMRNFQALLAQVRITRRINKKKAR